MPEFEAREACVYGNYNWIQWVDLPYDERARTVAQFRLHSLIDAHVVAAANRPRPAAKK